MFSNRSAGEDILTSWHVLGASSIRLGEAMSGYISYERIVAETMHPAYFVVAMIPCYRLWPWIGTQIDFVSTASIYSHS